jgi:hypothetical protein
LMSQKFKKKVNSRITPKVLRMRLGWIRRI